MNYLNLIFPKQTPSPEKTDKLSEEYFVNKQNLCIYTRKWIPEKMKAIIVLLHGYCEHSGRYHSVTKQLNKYGYGVYALDYQGHGKSEGTRAYVNNFDNYIDDVQTFVQNIQHELSEKKIKIPFFLLGHSMGGNIAIQVAQRDPTIWKAIYLSSPMIKIDPNKATTLLIIVSKILSYIIPKTIISNDSIGYEKLVRNKQVLEDYKKDELVYNGGITARTGYNLICACAKVQELNKNINFPFMIGIASDDFVCLPKSMNEFYMNSPSKFKRMVEYKGLYHEILFEPEADTVISDLIDYFDLMLE